MLDKLPTETPQSIIDMLQSCWHVYRRVRKSAVECYAVLNHQKYDSFFSHAWRSKPLLSRVYTQLISQGYRVWYDQNDMGYNLQESMRSGIANSTVVIACIDKVYQERPNCLFEI